MQYLDPDGLLTVQWLLWLDFSVIKEFFITSLDSLGCMGINHFHLESKMGRFWWEINNENNCSVLNMMQFEKRSGEL